MDQYIVWKQLYLRTLAAFNSQTRNWIFEAASFFYAVAADRQEYCFIRTDLFLSFFFLWAMALVFQKGFQKWKNVEICYPSWGNPTPYSKTLDISGKLGVRQSKG